MTRYRLTLAVLFLVNLLPVIGVLFWNWSLIPILVLYWMESFVVGVLNIPKILTSDGPLGSRIGTSFFFMVHYGGFWFGHTLFLWAFLMPEISDATGIDPTEALAGLNIKWAFAFLVASHLFSFAVNYIGRREFGRLNPTAQMFVPYGRVFVLHIVILFGASLLAKFAAVWMVALMFVVLKMIFDGFFHVITHKAYEAYPKPETASLP